MSVNVELSPELQEAVDEKLRAGEFRSADDFVRVAIQHFIEAERGIAHTESLLDEAAASGDYIELNEVAWAEIERDGRRIAGERRTGQDR